MEALLEAMERKRTQPFRIVVVLPARATSGKWDNDRHVEKLRKADAGRGIAEVYSLYSSGPSSGVHAFQYRPTYVHAKVGIFDDQWLTVGSANLNDRGLVTDSEMNVVVNDPSLAIATRADLWAEHLSLAKDEVAAADPIALVDFEWRQRAAANAAIIKSAEKPLTSQVRWYECGRQPESWLREESETLTFEH
jgi:phosphatidylserine/phosphatidylglycerophosphate/cardiolipin synthase-like enzyme